MKADKTNGWSRRDWLKTSSLAALGLGAGCRSTTAPAQGDPLLAARLISRPGMPGRSIMPGRYRLGLGTDRDGLLYVPDAYDPGVPATLIVMLHGAGSSAEDITAFPADANAGGAVLLVPDSRGGTWDFLRGGFGPDVAFIDAALRLTFESCAIRPDRVALFGFSDGASYALSLGLTNGDLFTNVAAFAPGVFAPPGQVARPHVFIAHAIEDPVLPISFSRALAPALRQSGYDVTYLEVHGGHVVNQEERSAAMHWLASA